MNTAPIDSVARTRALDTQRSFAVSAPAGSGKTGLLTQRVLALLSVSEQPENVLAITFTKKAATEMQERIFAALNEAENNELPPSDPFKKTTWDLAKKVLTQDKKYDWQLLQCPNRCRITTIDGFCRQLSQQSPLNHTLGDAPEILDQPEIAYLQAVRQTLALLESDEPIQEDIRRLIQHFNNQLPTIESLLVRLLSKRDQWLTALFSAKDKRSYLETVLQNIICEHFNHTSQLLADHASDIALFVDYAANNLKKDSSTGSFIHHCLGLITLPEIAVTQFNQWLGITELLITADGNIRKRVDKRQGFPTADKGFSKEEKSYAKQKKEEFSTLLAELSNQTEAIQALHEIRSLPAPSYSDSQWELLDSLTRVLHRLVAELFLTFQSLGKTDYTEITLAALDALGNTDNPTELSLILEYHLQHILIDEFQDTSSTQLLLLEKLTAGWQHGDGHTLFIVGDAMQSCYRFRNANVGLFLGLREHGLGDIVLENLDLEVNFRSHENVVNWVNTVFGAIFPRVNSIGNGAVSYSKALAFKQAPLSQNHSEIRCSLLINDNDRKAEANFIVKKIQSCRQQNPTQTIAILVRNRNQVPTISRALSESQIHYRATDIDSLSNHMIIQDLISLTRALLYPHDRIAWLSCLRTPWCGLDMHDLFAVANPEVSNGLTPDILSTILQPDSVELSPSGQSVFKNFSAVIKKAFAKQQRCSLMVWVESTWRALGGHMLLLDEYDANHADRFFTCLNQHDEGGRISHWPIFVSAVQSLYSQPQTTLDTSENCVEIMTIHKSKGLEFDTVIIPGIDKSQRSDSTELLEWMEHIAADGVRDLLISPVHATGNETDTIYHHIRQQSRKKQLLEADRVFYVGCTRAINHLYLVGCAEEIESNKEREEVLSCESVAPPKANSPLATLWPHIKHDIDVIATNITDETHSGERLHPNVIFRRPIGWQPDAIKPIELLAPFRPNATTQAHQNDGNRADREHLTQRHARYFGTVLHEALELITRLGYQNVNDSMLTRYERLWFNRLISLGTPEVLATQQIAKINVTLQTMLTNSDRHWFLDHSHTESECELTIYYFTGKEFKHNVIDRTFIIEDGGIRTRWIIDYKSSEPNEGQSLDVFIANELMQYQAQMQHYAQLFKHEGQPIKTALYFPLIDYFIEI